MKSVLSRFPVLLLIASMIFLTPFSLAQAEARRILAEDPGLRRPEHRGLVKALEERWEGRLALARVG